MFDNCYFDYYGKTEKNVYGQGVVSKIELWIDDNQSSMRKIGTVFSEERIWENFLETNYSCSDGTTVRLRHCVAFRFHLGLVGFQRRLVLLVQRRVGLPYRFLRARHAQRGEPVQCFRLLGDIRIILDDAVAHLRDERARLFLVGLI